MNCLHIQDLLPDYLLGLLSPAESAEVERHLSTGCYHCQAMLDELGEAAAMIPLTDPQAANRLAPPAELKHTLMQRVHEDARHRGAEAAAPTDELSAAARPRPRSRWKYVLGYAAAAAIAFVIGVQFTGAPSPRILTQAERERLYQDRMAQIQQSFDAQSVRLATATRSANLPEKQGAVVWDDQARQLHVYAFDLPSPEGESVLQAWLIDGSGAYTPIGTLQVDQQGDVAQALSVPTEVESVISLLVTEEPSPAGTPVPTGSQPEGQVLLFAPFQR